MRRLSAFIAAFTMPALVITSLAAADTTSPSGGFTRHSLHPSSVRSTAIESAPQGPHTFAAFGFGDVFVAEYTNTVTFKHYTNAGVFLEDLPSPGGLPAGGAFGPDNNLYGTNFNGSPSVSVWDHNHPHPIIHTYLSNQSGVADNESIVFAANGDFYVGSADGSGDVLRFNSAGVFQQAYNVATDNRGSDHVTLARDQSTLFYTSEGGRIMRYNLVADAQLPDFGNIGGESYGLKILPPGDASNGIIVSNFDDIKRLDAGGNPVQSYDVIGEDSWFAVDLDPNGTSFWSAGLFSGNFYRFNIATGAVEVGPINAGGEVSGICLFGEVIPGQCDLNPNAPVFTEPVCGSEQTVSAGSNVTISVSAGDADANDIVTLSDPGAPATSTFATVPGNPATGSFSWTPTAADAGDHVVTFTATDNFGCHATSCDVTIHVITNRDPICSAAEACEPVLWPPNHKYHSVSICGVTDPDGDPVTITVTSITQDEPVNTRGDGNTCPDALIVDGQGSVRAERTGVPSIPGNGRVYAVNFTASDGRGGECRGTVRVCVPHDQGHPTCIDDGQRYSSTGPCTNAGELKAETVNLKVGAVSATEAQFTLSLPNDAQVDVAVFDLSGRRLATIENGPLTSGIYERTWNMDGVPSGMYFVRMRANDAVLTRSVLKIR
jgi:hypothetical protein